MNGYMKFMIVDNGKSPQYDMFNVIKVLKRKKKYVLIKIIRML